MAEPHVNVNCESIKNYNYENHSTLGEMHTIQNCVGKLPTKIICTVQLQLFIKKKTNTCSQSMERNTKMELRTCGNNG